MDAVALSASVPFAERGDVAPTWRHGRRLEQTYPSQGRTWHAGRACWPLRTPRRFRRSTRVEGGSMTDMSRTNVELQALSQQLRDMTTAVVADDGLQAVEVRTVLRFINKVLQVLDQAFEDVYACLVDVRLLREDDLGSEHFSDVRRTVALIHARSRYRDAEEICSRLHHLSYEYGK